MDGWLDVGLGCSVLASEIVAIHDGDSSDEQTPFVVVPYASPASATIVLRGGQLFPAYVSAKTLMKRLREEE